jgi:hypothetical protein
VWQQHYCNVQSQKFRVRHKRNVNLQVILLDWIGSDDINTLLSGSCSDSLITLQLDPTQGPIRYGVCSVGYIHGTFYSIPGCIYPAAYCPMGCCDYSVASPDACEAQGGTWFLPAANQSSCVANKGCWEVDTNVATEPFYLHRFSTKDEKECGLCSQNYIPWFSWTPATYLTGNYKSLSQVITKYDQRFNWTSSALDFYQLYTYIINATNARVLLLGASSSLCQYVIWFALCSY